MKTNLNPFFLNIEGLSSENLTTEILATILHEEKYSTHQRLFYNYLLNDNSNKCTASRGLRITTQEFFKDGRPDLVIKGIDAVYILENKFFAEFTNDQLKRYRKILNNEFKEFRVKKLFLLTIKDRKGYYLNCIRNIMPEVEHELNIVLWEDILEFFQSNDFIVEAMITYIQKTFLTKVEFGEEEIKMISTIKIPETLNKIFDLVKTTKRLLNDSGFNIGHIEQSYRFYGFYIRNETITTWFGYGFEWWLNGKQTITPLFMQIREIFEPNPKFDNEIEDKFKLLNFYSIKDEGWIKPYSPELFINNEELVIRIKSDMQQLTEFILLRNRAMKL